jgi:hypothetical protein
MTGNILGRNINPIIDEQIFNRQFIHGSGQTDGDIQRSPKVLNYLNNRNAWIKMASGVGISGSFGVQKLKDLSSSEDDYLTDTEIQNLKSYGLAQNLILFNSTQRYDKTSQSYVSRSGVRENNNLSDSINKLYGGIGNNERGLQPVPGITDISVECLNRGSIRKAVVNIKAYNKFQFGLIELLYLRLGYMVMLEFGWDKYVSEIKKEGGEFNVEIEDVGSTVIENEWFSSNTRSQESIFNSIEQYTQRYKGNYNGFFGKVSNFTWKLNKDNTYDITLNLITIGSVIESLKVNLPTEGLTETKLVEQKKKLQEKFELDDNDDGTEPTNPILNNAGADKLSQFIAATIIGFPFNDKNYAYLPNLANLNSNRKKIPPTSRYYIKFGTLLEKIEAISIPDVKNGNTINAPLINFDTDSVNTLCNYQVNLIPLVPSKVIFSPILEGNYLTKTTKGAIQKFQDKLLPFATEKDKIYYGRLLNCYFNMNFVSETLAANRDEKGDVTLFKFIESLCSAINESTGQTTNLEPAIKTDRSIYILEQNPIKGFDSVFTQKDPTEIIIYGYNGQRSTFVKDFGFQTKITPDLASMISIGAAAEGSTTKDINAIPFSFWNKGLQNRFQEVLTDSAVKLVDTEEESSKYNVEDQDVIDAFKSQILNGKASYTSGWSDSQGYSFSYNGFRVGGSNGSAGTKGIGIKSPKVSLFSGRSNDAKDDKLLSNGLKMYKEAVKKRKEDQNKLNSENGESNVKIVSKASSAADNYSNFLTNCFGGATGEYTAGEFVERTYRTRRKNKETGRWETKSETRSSYTGKRITILERNAKWWDITNNDFIQQGVSAFKLYLNQIEQAEYNKAEPVLSAQGFIPVELSLTMDGIGGINIYNKIKVDTRILPASYPRSLKFIATKVNHSIKSNNWETSVTTISVPPTKTATGAEAGDTANANYNAVNNPVYQQPLVNKGPIPPNTTDVNQKLKIKDNRTVGGQIYDPRTYGSDKLSIDWLVGEMNINTQNTYRQFFNILLEKYPGYTLVINATYRTYQRSIELKEINSSNATPGYSPHNYAYGIDMNVIDPNGKVYRKADRTPWVESGIPEIAKSLGMRWGGSFKNYVDCVHFDVTRVTDASIANAKRENAGLPQSQWNTKDTNYV